MAKRDKETTSVFTGFDPPTSNWFRMPNNWTDITAEINNLAELKVVEYILRHTWGYQEYGQKKHITIDEFVNGRRRHDATRMDKGTGLSERAVYDGLRKAVERGLIEEDVDNTDRGRVKKSYSLKMREDGPGKANGQPLQDLHPGVQSLHPPLQTVQPRGAKSAPPTEKDTSERTNNSNIRNAAPEEFLSGQPNGGGEGGASGDSLRTRLTALQAVAATPTARLTKPEQLARRGTGPVAVGESLKRRRGRAAGSSEDRQVIVAYLSDFAREMNDQAPLRVSVTRALNLLARSGLSRDDFVQRLYEARSLVKEHSASIQATIKRDGSPVPVKAKMAYFFAVLEDLCGLKEPQDNPTPPN